MAIGDAFSAPMGVKNQMVGQPQRMPSGVPGYDAGYAQAPGQPRLPAEPYPIGRPTGVVGGPAYYTPPGFQAPPQPTEAFMPTDVRPDPIGQQFMRQYQSPMGQQFIDQYEATQAPMRAREAELRDAERARQDQRFQEMMDRIAELEGQLTAREEAATIPQIDIPGYDPNNPFNIDLSKLPDLSGLDLSGLQERFPYLDLLSKKQPQEVKDMVAKSLATGEPILSPERVQEMINRMGGQAGPVEAPQMPPKRGDQLFIDDMPRFISEERKIGKTIPDNLPGRAIQKPFVSELPPMPQMTAPAPIPVEGVTTDRIPEGMRFMGQPLIPTNTPPRKGSFLSAVARPDLPPPNISGPFGFIRSKPSIDSMPSPISIPSLPISRTERPMPSMPNIPRINLSKLGIR